jgi:hypothetical protein
VPYLLLVFTIFDVLEGPVFRSYGIFWKQTRGAKPRRNPRQVLAKSAAMCTCKRLTTLGMQGIGTFNQLPEFPLTLRCVAHALPRQAPHQGVLFSVFKHVCHHVTRPSQDNNKQAHRTVVMWKGAHSTSYTCAPSKPCTLGVVASKEDELDSAPTKK